MSGVGGTAVKISVAVEGLEALRALARIERLIEPALDAAGGASAREVVRAREAALAAFRADLLAAARATSLFQSARRSASARTRASPEFVGLARIHRPRQEYGAARPMDSGPAPSARPGMTSNQRGSPR
jgi:hypothetical protein